MGKQNTETVAPEIKDQQDKLAAAADDPNVKLPEAIAKNYDVKKGSVRVFYSTKLGRTIDLNKISEADAAKLAETGRLKKKEQTALS